MSKPEKPDAGAVNRQGYNTWAARAVERLRGLSGEKAASERRRLGLFLDSLKARKAEKLPSLEGIDADFLDNLKHRIGAARPEPVEG